ncbi:AAA family ATPase [Advenella sp. RU8]|uniref:AAA family ATPase n=1 Tax=Advenella sp. RU8 TaxID=3399575 RepID=UPI003AB00A65
MPAPCALFILGHAGTGKSALTTLFIQQQLEQQHTWCVLDKDTVGEYWTGPFLEACGQDPNDRDSPFFKETIRDLQYKSTLLIGKEQLALGLNVVFPGPWSRELATGALFSAQALGLPENTRLYHVWLDLPHPVRKARIIHRGDPRDQWKLANWDDYINSLKKPAAVEQGKIPVLDASTSREALLEALQDLLAITTPNHA